jgi:hypothetical protein
MTPWLAVVAVPRRSLPDAVTSISGNSRVVSPPVHHRSLPRADVGWHFMRSVQRLGLESPVHRKLFRM